jgi:DNA-directed RNA polymerase specialized sigma24 family protein
MPITKRPEPNDEDEIPSVPKGAAARQDRIAAFVMLDAMTNKTQAEKSVRLKLVGFSNTEIAQMLQTTPAVVASNIYQEKKKAAKKNGGRKGAGPEESRA